MVFIDVHCEGAESKSVVQSKLQELGSRVVASFSKTVTHVVSMKRKFTHTHTRSRRQRKGLQAPKAYTHTHNPT